MPLTGKKILIGITGGIAAYKVCELIRMFKKQNACVKTVVTKSALEFVTPLTLETLSQESVYYKQFETESKKPEHIALCDWADVFFFAPAMNTGMWNNKAVQKNIETLKSYGARFVDPDSGYLACGTEGKGRLADLNDICDAVKNVLQNADESADNKFLKGKKVVITAGGTKENFDPVRYIGNYSSGKMGAALAQKAFEAGASVTLIETTPLLRDCSDSINTVDVVSAKEMLEAVKEEFLNKNADILIMTAAVADYRPETTEQLKVKKENTDELTIKLVKNPDILSEMCKLKKEGMQIVGFCAETNDLIENAKAKIKRKGCDWLVANDVSRKDTGFSSDFNEVYVLDKNLNIVKIDKDTKENIASKILEQIWQKQAK